MHRKQPASRQHAHKATAGRMQHQRAPPQAWPVHKSTRSTLAARDRASTHTGPTRPPALAAARHGRVPAQKEASASLHKSAARTPAAQSGVGKERPRRHSTQGGAAGTTTRAEPQVATKSCRLVGTTLHATLKGSCTSSMQCCCDRGVNCSQCAHHPTCNQVRRPLSTAAANGSSQPILRHIRR